MKLIMTMFMTAYLLALLDLAGAGAFTTGVFSWLGSWCLAVSLGAFPLGIFLFCCGGVHVLLSSLAVGHGLGEVVPGFLGKTET